MLIFSVSFNQLLIQQIQNQEIEQGTPSDDVQDVDGTSGAEQSSKKTKQKQTPTNIKKKIQKNNE